jgi:hypothetical protein
MMRRRLNWLMAGCCLLTALFCHGVVSWAQPHLLRYQGQLTDSQGVPLEGPYDVTFSLYNAASGGAKVWEETQPNIPLAGGRFSVLLGQVRSLDLDWRAPCWLTLRVGNDPTEFSPRQLITSVPMAIRAEVAERAESGTWSDVISARAFGASYWNTSGKKRRVSVIGTGVMGAKAGLNLRVGMNNPPSSSGEIATSFNNTVAAPGSAHTVTVSGEVPANWYYNVGNVNGNETVTKWFELDE